MRGKIAIITSASLFRLTEIIYKFIIFTVASIFCNNYYSYLELISNYFNLLSFYLIIPGYYHSERVM